MKKRRSLLAMQRLGKISSEQSHNSNAVYGSPDVNPHEDLSPNKLPNYLNNSNTPFTLIHPKHSGTFKWMQGDDLDSFNINKNKAGKNWKYLTKQVTYTVNSSGYRAPEWNQIDWKKSIVLFGCSCTYGTGISDDETIAFHLEKLSGRPVINMGVPGGSNSLMIQNGISILDYFEAPYAVANIWSTSNRFRFFMDDHDHSVGPWDRKNLSASKFADISKLWKLTYVDPYHEAGLTYYEGRTGHWLWNGRSKYSSISFFPETTYFTKSERHFIIDNDARDLIHPGEGNSIEVANYLHERFK